MIKRISLFLILFIYLNGCSSSSTVIPENKPLLIAQSRTQHQVASNAMVATSHDLATKAGIKMLKNGGNAIDATVAAAFVLGVVEPMMAGIGGGGSMTVWYKETEEARHYEFYASAGADSGKVGPGSPDSLITPEQEVAVPGTVDGLLKAHKEYGKLSREEVLEPAITAAEEGFIIHPLLARTIREQKDKLHVDSAAAKLFYPNGEPLRTGEKLVQDELAATLKQISRQGPRGFYEGPVAEHLIARLQQGESPLTLEDFRKFKTRIRQPLLGDYHQYTVLAPPPPMAGMEVIETLNLLELYDLASMGLPAEDPRALSLLTDAIRISRADRYLWNGDPRGVGVPAAAVASDKYAAHRQKFMGGAVPDSLPGGDPWNFVQRGQEVTVGNISGYPFTSFDRPDESQKEGQKENESSNSQTTHLSIIDKNGNAVTLTFTMGLYFGSGVYAEGAFLNTAGRNFDQSPTNKWGPYRTPRSSTAPTMVLENSDVRLVVGSPGSGRIPPAIDQMILYTLHYNISPLDAIYMPRIYPFTNSNTVMVEDGFPTPVLAHLADRGYELEILAPYDLYFGGVHMVYVTEDGRLVGVADPRRNGTVDGY
ncbi:MAG: gamma-glutamyltransferase [Balneolaceae bacterium]|nr:gamma-glutamyltransferase [Balneolaceae bacterium]